MIRIRDEKNAPTGNPAPRGSGSHAGSVVAPTVSPIAMKPTSKITITAASTSWVHFDARRFAACTTVTATITATAVSLPGSSGTTVSPNEPAASAATATGTVKP